MSENVFIFGAGASRDAGIPLLASFVQVMWEIAIKETVYGERISPQDAEIFKNAIKVRDELDTYHGRANFNDRNIEDLLSILTFNQIYGTRTDRDRMNWLIKAIGRTIELMCATKYDEAPRTIQNVGPQVYRDFWTNYFTNPITKKDLPTIITFNYDLVLERSLFQTINNKIFNRQTRTFPYEGITVDYHLKDQVPLRYSVDDVSFGHAGFDPPRGTFMKPMRIPLNNEGFAKLDLLKLHGSVNFPKGKTDIIELCSSISDPLISPPIFNKSTSTKTEDVWASAMKALRSAKNVVFVGYSLPKTDIYMQYFIKSALGPNRDLNNVFVYDPAFSKESNQATQLKNRYLDCFTEQFRDRLVFIPKVPIDEKVSVSGTFQSFVNDLGRTETELLF